MQPLGGIERSRCRVRTISGEVPSQITSYKKPNNNYASTGTNTDDGRPAKPDHGCRERDGSARISYDYNMTCPRPLHVAP